MRVLKDKKEVKKENVEMGGYLYKNFMIKIKRDLRVKIARSNNYLSAAEKWFSS